MVNIITRITSYNVCYTKLLRLIRLLKPLEYYHEKYGTWDWGLKKLYLLMEKQHNRGQDGAGLISIKMSSSPGKEYIHRVRSIESEPIKDLFKQIDIARNKITTENINNISVEWAKENMAFAGEVIRITSYNVCYTKLLRQANYRMRCKR